MSQCFKCKQGIGTVASRDGPKALYCTDCFLSYCASAVRDNLFQQCFLACDTPVAVAVSGGPNSLLLLRELGQLRQKTREQYRRQQQQQQHHRHRTRSTDKMDGAETDNIADEDAETRSTSTTTTTTNGQWFAAGSSHPALGTTIELLPFHLCEAELVLPPSPSPPPVEATADVAIDSVSLHTSAHHAAMVHRVRDTMQQQFDRLIKLVQQQPPLWRYHDESLDGNSSKKKKLKKKLAKKAAAAAAAIGDEGENEEASVNAVPLFEKGEVRIFQYSDFLPAAYIAELRHAFHVSKLSLSDREALYDRVRQQVLCRAAQRVTDEFRRTAAHVSPSPPTSMTVSHVGDTRNTTDTAPRWYHVLVGDNAARCATAALEAIVTGAGGDGVVHAAGYRGCLHEVVCLRPMRSMLPKETVLCSRLHGITASYTPALRTGTSLRSMHQVVEQFVYTMISSFRTMIFNVLNTVQRLQVHPEEVQQLVDFVRTRVTPRHEDDLTGGSGEGGHHTASTAPRTAKKAMPGRTAQQNCCELRSMQPPRIHHTPSCLTEDSASNLTNAEAADEDHGTQEVAVQCCVCGCPVSSLSLKKKLSPPCGSDWHADSALHRQVDMFPLTATSAATNNGEDIRRDHPSSAQLADLDSFVCYACRSLLEGFPASAFTATDVSSNALRAACVLFQQDKDKGEKDQPEQAS